MIAGWNLISFPSNPSSKEKSDELQPVGGFSDAEKPDVIGIAA